MAIGEGNRRFADFRPSCFPKPGALGVSGGVTRSAWSHGLNTRCYGIAGHINRVMQYAEPF